MYKLDKNLLPTTIGNYFERDPYVNQHSYGLRSRTANLPTRLVSRTKYAEKSFQIGGQKFWNKLPIDIRNVETLSIFKKCYKTYLLDQNEQDIDDSIFTQ